MKIKLACLSSRHLLQSNLLFFFLLILASTLLMVSADVSAKKSKTKKVEKEETREIVWPASPSEPVVRYLREFRSESELATKKKSSWKDSLLGKKEEVSGALERLRDLDARMAEQLASLIKK